MITLIVAAKRRADLTIEQFNHHWLSVHAPLVISVSEFSRYLRKYALYPYAPNPAGGALVLGQGSSYDGVGELWFESRADMEAAFSEPRYLEIIRPDEDRFLDRDACLSFVTEEHIMIPRRT